MRKLLLVACSLPLVVWSPGLAQVREEPPDSLDRFIEEKMQERQIPGLALAIARNGDTIAARGYGLADAQNGSPVTPATRFDLASVTKQVTAAGIMLLVEEGRIDLDASIETYLPDVPEKWSEITVRHLLTHTSGLPLHTTWSPPIDISREMWFEAAAEDPLEFEPGHGFQYSDPGYTLLGFITEEVTGTPWSEFIHARIFESLGMYDSYVSDRLRVYRNEARTYDLRQGEVVNARRVYRGESAAHNGIFSNVLDLVKWDAALYSDRLLSDESREASWSRTRLADGTRHPYGFGWVLSQRSGRPIQFHGGATGTTIIRIPQDTLVVIVLANLDRSGAHDLAMSIAEMMIPDLQQGLAADPEDVGRYVGEYVNERGLSARILSSGGGLSIIPPRADRRVELVYQGGTHFTIGRGNSAVEFVPGEGEEASGFILYPADYVLGAVRFTRK